jgi:hypothetical protein
MCTVFIHDGGVSAALGKEAAATGWHQIAGLMTSGSTSGSYTSSINVGSGSGQFPLPAQLQTTGHVAVRKSTTADTVFRNWFMYADAYTFYLFTQPGDSNYTTQKDYSSFQFGDIYSNGVNDLYKCVILGRYLDNNGNASNNATEDDMHTSVNIARNGFYIVKSVSGHGESVLCAKCGDTGKAIPSNIVAGVGWLQLGGLIHTNTTNNGLYVSPIWVVEVNYPGSTALASTRILRGRMRGMYHLCHPINSFTDGQILYGANSYSGKTFQVVFPGYNGGTWLIETSNTVEVN